MFETFDPRIALLALAVLASVVVVAVVLRRIGRLMAQMRNPQELGQLLTETTRQELIRHGVDPDALSGDDLDLPDELRERVLADVRRAFLGGVVLGRPPTTGGRMGDPHSTPDTHQSPRSIDMTFGTYRPPAIDEMPANRSRVVMIALGGLLALIGLAILLR